MTPRPVLRPAGACLATLGVVLSVLNVLSGGCGKRGAPLPPLRPVPGNIEAVAIERTGARVTIKFTIPAANADGTSPGAADRIDVFALTQPADAPPPTPLDLIRPDLVVSSVTVAPVPEKPEPGAKPYAGQPATIVDVVKDGAASSTRYYTLMAMAGRRRGPHTPIYPVRLVSSPAAPERVTAEYTETAIMLAWPAVAALQYRVEETNESGAPIEGGVRTQKAESGFETALEFGKRRCFVVRGVAVADAVSILGDPTPPVCVTPTDKFPPPAPTGLQAFARAEGEGIDLSWTAVAAADLGGYLILRAEGANGTLQPLTPAPVAEAAYRDRAVQAGVTYAYAIVAVDKASPPNRSEPSAREFATARGPVFSPPHR